MALVDLEPGISACLIVKDEEAFIEECLRRLWKAVDEVVVVDTGSTDATASLASHSGARVLYHPWQGSFAEARNFCLAQAQYTWILVVDADELLDEASLEALSKLNADEADAYYVDVVNLSDDPNQKVISKHIAVFKNDPRYRYEGAIHERIGPAINQAGGRIRYLPLRVEHLGYLKHVREAKGKRQRNRTIIVNELRKRPSNILLQFYMAQECFVDGELDEAAAYYARTLSQAPMGSSLIPAAVIRLMDILLRLSRWEEAFELYEAYSRRYPDYTDLHFLAGVLSRRVQDFGQAEVRLLKAISLGDAAPEKYEIVSVGCGTYHAWSELADLYRQVGRDREAYLAFLEALRANARYGRAARGLAEVALRHDPAPHVLGYLKGVADLDDPACAREVWHEFFATRAWDQCNALTQVLDPQELKYRNMLVMVRRGELERAKAMTLELALEDEWREQAAMTGALLALESGDTEWGHRLHDLVSGPSHGAIATVLADLLAIASASEADPVQALPLTHAATADVAETGWKLADHAVELGQVRALEAVGMLLARYGEHAGKRALRFGKILWRYGLQEGATEQCLIAGRQGVYDEESLLIIAQHAVQAGAQRELVTLLQKVIEMVPGRAVPYLVLARTYKALGEIAKARETLSAGLEHNSHAILLKREMRRLRDLSGVPGA